MADELFIARAVRISLCPPIPHEITAQFLSFPPSTPGLTPGWDCGRIGQFVRGRDICLALNEARRLRRRIHFRRFPPCEMDALLLKEIILSPPSSGYEGLANNKPHQIKFISVRPPNKLADAFVSILHVHSKASSLKADRCRPLDMRSDQPQASPLVVLIKPGATLLRRFSDLTKAPIDARWRASQTPEDFRAGPSLPHSPPE